VCYGKNILYQSIEIWAIKKGGWRKPPCERGRKYKANINLIIQNGKSTTKKGYQLCVKVDA
jgi:hypothetical protein